jgi:Uncharacterized conserved protein
MVSWGNYCIDRYEAHLVESGHLHPHNQRPSADSSYAAVSSAGFFPQAYLSRDEAARACEKSLKRLCTLEEWVEACRGPKHLTYPYGDEEIRGKCNSGKPPLLQSFFKSIDRKSWGYETHFNNPLLNEVPGFLAKTGEFSECVNEVGAFDMVGNLHEWVSTSVTRDLPRLLKLNDRISGYLKGNLGRGIFMGGFFSTSNEHGSGCGFITIGHEPAYHDYSTGFRCCKDVP